jgi:DNA-binding MarR family transcriptional regulator
MGCCTLKVLEKVRGHEKENKPMVDRMAEVIRIYPKMQVVELLILLKAYQDSGVTIADLVNETSLSQYKLHYHAKKLRELDLLGVENVTEENNRLVLFPTDTGIQLAMMVTGAIDGKQAEPNSERATNT